MSRNFIKFFTIIVSLHENIVISSISKYKTSLIFFSSSFQLCLYVCVFFNFQSRGLSYF